MDIGSAKNLISFAHPKTNTGAAGGIPMDYETPYLTNIWAKLMDLNVNQLLAARAAFSEVGSIFEIRWRTGIQPNDRLTFKGRLFNVLGVLDPDNGQQIRAHVYCRELSNGI